MVEQNNNLFNGGKDSEQTGGIEIFSPETIGALENTGRKIYSLTGKTISQLRDEGCPISREWVSYRDVDDEMQRFQSRRSQVAIEDIEAMPKKYTLLRSFDKSVQEQVSMVKRSSDQLQRDIPGAKMIIGNPIDYIELAWETYKATGRNLFESEYLLPFLSKLIKRKFKQHWFARTDTPLKSVGRNFAFAVSYYSGIYLVTAWPRQEGNHIMGVLPLIVPAEQKSKE